MIINIYIESQRAREFIQIALLLRALPTCNTFQRNHRTLVSRDKGERERNKQILNYNFQSKKKKLILLTRTGCSVCSEKW